MPTDDFLSGTGAPLTRRQRGEVALIAVLLGVALTFPMLRTANWFLFDVVQDASFTEGSRLTQVVFGSIFLVAGLLVWRYGALLWPQLRRTNPFLLAMVAWACLTMLWSPAPDTTLKRCVQLVGLLLLGLTLTLPWLSPRLLTSVLIRALTALVIVSAVVSVLLPAIGVDPIRGNAWRGITWHKNTLGAAAAFACLLWVIALATQRVTPRAGLLGLLVLGGVLLLAKSSTALATGIIAIGVFLFMRRRFVADVNLGTVLALSLALVLGSALMAFFAVMGRLPTWAELMTPVTTLLNRDADLTGRTELWELVLFQAIQHPLRGLGYGAFWLNVGSASQYIIDIVGWVPLQAHSAYVDIFNEMGLVGLLLFVGTVVWHISALRQIGRTDPDFAATHWAVLALILVSNVAETQIFNGVSFQNNLFFFSVILVAARKHRLPRRQPVPVAFFPVGSARLP